MWSSNRLRIVQPPAALVFIGDAQNLADRQRNSARGAGASPSVHRVAETLDDRPQDRHHRLEVRAIMAVAIHRTVVQRLGHLRVACGAGVAAVLVERQAGAVERLADERRASRARWLPGRRRCPRSESADSAASSRRDSAAPGPSPARSAALRSPGHRRRRSRA